MSLCHVLPSSCKKYKTALDDLSKASNTGGDETPQVIRYAGCFISEKTFDRSAQMERNPALNVRESRHHFCYVKMMFLLFSFECWGESG